MALQQLNDEQIKTWSRAQKDEWWLKNIYRGDMPQLTLRSALTGFLLGGILAATNLYIGGKTGITTGVGLTSVILAFAFYRILAQSGIAQDFTILENNCTQSIATAAVILSSAASVASAQSVESFYKSTNLTITVGSGAGGGYDVYTRVLARSLPKHIPGKADIEAQKSFIRKYKR
ncbi:MAG: OPT/YSL family transporter, partial [Opitutaceae bacterium]